MNVVIAGAGPGGVYLYHLLRQRRPELAVEIFDNPHDTNCGVKPCGWAVPKKQFLSLCKYAQIDAGKYVRCEYNSVQLFGVNTKASTLVIDKPRFLKELAPEVERKRIPDPARYYRLVDATGRRVYLSSRDKRFMAKTVQVRCISKYESPLTFLNRRGGYSWIVPLGKGHTHIGSLSPLNRSEAESELVRFLPPNQDIICRCYGEIWFGGPILPFVEQNVWGLGESIGLVSPLMGAGIIQAMSSAAIMERNWGLSESYSKSILSGYRILLRESSLVRRQIAGKKITVLDMPIIKRALNGSGIYPTPKSFFKLLNHCNDSNI